MYVYLELWVKARDLIHPMYHLEPFELFSVRAYNPNTKKCVKQMASDFY